MLGSVRGALGNQRPYRDQEGFPLRFQRKVGWKELTQLRRNVLPIDCIPKSNFEGLTPKGFLHPVNIARSLEKGEKVFDKYREKWDGKN